MKQYADDSLLGTLSAALRIDTSPSPHEVEDLRALVISREHHAVVVPMIAPRRPARLMRVAAVAAAVVVGAVGIAKLAGTSMPGSMRDPARAVGFPVDSQEITDARAALGQLRAALAQSSDHHLAVAADLLRVRLRALSPDELRQIGPEAADLLSQADARLLPPEPSGAAGATKTDETPAAADTGSSGSGAGQASPPAVTSAPVGATASDKEPAREDKTSDSASAKLGGD